MRSFTLTAFATLAFGIFCSAAPTPSGGVIPIPPPVAVRDTTVPAENTQTLQIVITDATNAVGPLADQVANINLQTVDAIEKVLAPILQQVVTILETAVSEVEELANIPVEKSLIDIATGLLMDVKTIVQLIAPLLTVVLTLLQNVLKLVGGTVTGDLVPLVDQITVLLAQLLSAILSLVGTVVSGIVTPLLNSIGGLVSVIITLNAQQLLALLGISL